MEGVKSQHPTGRWGKGQVLLWLKRSKTFHCSFKSDPEDGFPPHREEIFKRPSPEACCCFTLRKITHPNRQGLRGAAAALSPQPRRTARRPAGCAEGTRGSDPLPGWLRLSAATPGAASGERAGNPQPLPPALKDVVLFLPRTKDNKGSGGATHRVEARPPAPSAHSSPRLQDCSPAADSRPRRRPPPSRAPAAVAAEPRASRARPSRAPLPRAPASARGRLASAAASSLPRSPPGQPGTAPSAAASPWAAAGRLTARVAAASPAILCRVWCLSRLLARLCSLLLLPPPTRPTHHTTWPLRCGGGCGGGRSSAAFQLAPLPQPPACSPGTPSAHALHHQPAAAIGWVGFLPSLPSSLTHSGWCLPPAWTTSYWTLLVYSDPTSSTFSASIGLT